MKILIIRHGDPNYEIDGLTEKGRREAEFLSERISELDVRKFYVSPLGRAKATAAYTLEKMGRTAEECPWLREFDAHITDEHSGEQRIPWDLLPEDWTKVGEYYSKAEWYKAPLMDKGNVIAEAKKSMTDWIRYSPRTAMSVRKTITVPKSRTMILSCSSATSALSA